MLMLSLFAIITAVTCLWLEFDAYDRDMDAKAAKDAMRRLSQWDASPQTQRAVVMRAVGRILPHELI